MDCKCLVCPSLPLMEEGTEGWEDSSGPTAEGLAGSGPKRRRSKAKASGVPGPSSGRRAATRKRAWWRHPRTPLIAGAVLGGVCAVLLVLAWEAMPLPPGIRGASGTPKPASRIEATGRLLLPLNYNLSLVSLPSRTLQTIVPSGDRGVITGARWCPDGRQFAYTHFRPRGKEPIGADIATVQISDSTVSTPTTVVERDRPGATFDSPTWTPDHRALYMSYSAIEGDQPVERIEKVDIQSGARVPIMNGRVPELSPDGNRLAFVRSDQSGDSRWLASADGTNARELLRPDGITTIGPTRFSPDGKMIAIALSRPADQAHSASPRSPWTLRSTRLAFAHGNPWEIYLMDATGGPARRLTQLQEDEIGITWSPNGSQLAMFGLRGVHLIDSEGRTTFAMDQSGFGGIDWAP